MIELWKYVVWHGLLPKQICKHQCVNIDNDIFWAHTRRKRIVFEVPRMHGSNVLMNELYGSNYLNLVNIIYLCWTSSFLSIFPIFSFHLFRQFVPFIIVFMHLCIMHRTAQDKLIKYLTESGKAEFKELFQFHKAIDQIISFKFEDGINDEIRR